MRLGHWPKPRKKEEPDVNNVMLHVIVGTLPKTTWLQQEILQGAVLESVNQEAHPERRN